MAKVFTNPRYLSGPTSALELTAVLDQVDNNTNATQLFKNNIYNIMNEYNRKEARLKTFANWPLAWLDKHQLARTACSIRTITIRSRAISARWRSGAGISMICIQFLNLFNFKLYSQTHAHPRCTRPDLLHHLILPSKTFAYQEKAKKR
ncbi:uncharacterized protein LOC113566047 [Drosophila persimilis]|uniref:uncharacterized protein LOC113566047 n=1 Tax=Drosophila persimilis TaxID=7234 RepID=UPI000F07E7D4|nr:uncharacterized protein LOC113566047 [Drosophila persimilis]